MKETKDKGITLIVLVITIVILLVLAGITISTVGEENGLLTRATQAKQAQIESEMKEQLALALQDLQIEKLGNATLDDITQEWIDSKIQNYDCTIKEDASISGKRIIMEKNGVICKFLIDENLNSTVIEESESGAQLEYEAVSKDGENVNILVTITDPENGLQQVEFPDGTVLYCNGEEQVAKDYKVQLGVEYIVKITSKGGQIKEEIILINDYYYKITMNLDEGISIDNAAIKAAYNKPYKAIITVEEGYIIDSLTVTMGGEVVEVDKSTGMIEIEKVTGDIVITTATPRRAYLQLNGGTYISTNILQSDFMGTGKEFTIAIQVNINREKQSRVQHMDILGNHYYSSGLVLQFNEYSTNLLLLEIGEIDYTPYYDKWTDIVITSKDGIVKMYVNNELLLQGDWKHSPYGGLMIGNGYSDISRSMVGDISSFKLWTKELSVEEIEQLNLLQENTTIAISCIMTEVIFNGIEDVNEIGMFVGTGYSFVTTN